MNQFNSSIPFSPWTINRITDCLLPLIHLGWPLSFTTFTPSQLLLSLGGENHATLMTGDITILCYTASTGPSSPLGNPTIYTRCLNSLSHSPWESTSLPNFFIFSKISYASCSPYSLFLMVYYKKNWSHLPWVPYYSILFLLITQISPPTMFSFIAMSN